MAWEERGGWAPGAAGWMEFMGCGEAAGSDRGLELRAPPRAGQPLGGLLEASPAAWRQPGASSGKEGYPRANSLALQQPPPLCGARAPRGAARPRRLCLPLPARVGPRSRGAAQAARSGGRAPRRPGYPLRSSNAASREAERRPRRAGALLSLVWNFYPPRKPQAGAGAVGSGRCWQAVWPLGADAGRLGG